MFFRHPRIHWWVKRHAGCAKMLAGGHRRFCKDCVHFKVETSKYMMSSDPLVLSQFEIVNNCLGMKG